MLGLRILVSIVILLPSAFIAYLLFALHGLKQNTADPGFNTLPVAIPWTVATVVLAVLLVGAIASPERSERWSAWAFGLASVMAAVVLGVIVIDSI